MKFLMPSQHPPFSGSQHKRLSNICVLTCSVKLAFLSLILPHLSEDINRGHPALPQNTQFFWFLDTTPPGLLPASWL